MLLKVETINEVGRFASLKHKAPQFGPLTLIYGRNGYGKSTLSAVLRSAAEQDAKLIAARRRLGAAAESKVQLQWQGGKVFSFASGKWNGCPGPVYIFDRDFVRRNLHVADSVTRDNKRNLIPVILGASGVALAKTISDLDQEQKDKTAEQSAAAKVIRTAHPVVADVEVFAPVVVPTDIDAQISDAEKKLELAKHALAVRDKKDPAQIACSPLDRWTEIAGRDLEGVSDQAAAQVKAHLDARSMHPNGERWLRYGLDHMQGESCPFCTQDTSTIDVVKAFRGFFSEANAKLAEDISAGLQELGALYGANGRALDDVLDGNAVDFDFWDSVCDLGARPSLDAGQRTALKTAIKDLIDLLDAKATDQLKGHSLGAKQTGVESALALLTTYNAGVAKCAVAIQEARASITGADPAKAQELVEKRRALKAKASSPIKDQVDLWQAASGRLAEIDTEKKAAQEALRQHVKTSVSSRQATINELLQLFGANFSIEDTKASFVGREPNTDFSIALGKHVVNAGERKEDQPSFDSLLSSGDKSTLALAFFIAQVRAAPDLKDAVIIFDDPFSSQDMQRQWETTSQLRSLAKASCQVVVLSHDPRFLALIEKNANACGTYQLMCDDTGEGSISQWAPDDELKEIYVKQAERIREFASTGVFLKGCTAESLIKDLRPFMEDFIKARFPGRFAPLVMLDQMATDIENAGATDPLHKDVAAFRAINEYGRDNMHGGASAPDPGQLRAQCKRIVSVVGSY